MTILWISSWKSQSLAMQDNYILYLSVFAAQIIQLMHEQLNIMDLLSKNWIKIDLYDLSVSGYEKQYDSLLKCISNLQAIWGRIGARCIPRGLVHNMGHNWLYCASLLNSCYIPTWVKPMLEFFNDGIKYLLHGDYDSW